MGNALSEEEETQILEEAYSMSLESPEADKVLNEGTSAPNCQPKHSQKQEQREDNDNPERMSEKHRRNSSMSDTEERRKRQHTDQQQQQQMTAAQQQKKLSYIQMARLGYQELVNAIIRPPRADYKVGTLLGVVCNGDFFAECSVLILLRFVQHTSTFQFLAICHVMLQNRWKLLVLRHLRFAERDSLEQILPCGQNVDSILNVRTGSP